MKKVVTHSFQGEGHVLPQRDHMGNAMFGQREGANVGQSFYCSSLKKGQAGKGGQVYEWPV